MTTNEAKNILLLYRPGMADGEDPQMAEALALAKNSPELNRWLETHWAAQEALRTKFKHITPPPGLKEQIISEHAASRRVGSRQSKALVLTVTVVLLLAGVLAIFRISHNRPALDRVADYQTNMVSIAMRIYPMDLTTNSLASIQAYLAQQQSPSQFTLSTGLEKTTVAGCGVEHWQNAKVSLVCYRTGKQLPPGASSDLWLFVTDRSALKTGFDSAVPRYAKINKMITATWSQGGELYVLVMEGSEADIKQYL